MYGVDGVPLLLPGLAQHGGRDQPVVAGLAVIGQRRNQRNQREIRKRNQEIKKEIREIRTPTRREIRTPTRREEIRTPTRREIRTPTRRGNSGNSEIQKRNSGHPPKKFRNSGHPPKEIQEKSRTLTKRSKRQRSQRSERTGRDQDTHKKQAPHSRPLALSRGSPCRSIWRSVRLWVGLGVFARSACGAGHGVTGRDQKPIRRRV